MGLSFRPSRIDDAQAVRGKHHLLAPRRHLNRVKRRAAGRARYHSLPPLQWRRHLQRALRIFKTYGHAAILVMTENPYRLARHPRQRRRPDDGFLDSLAARRFSLIILQRAWP